MGVKRLIYPSFLIEVGYKLLTEEIKIETTGRHIELEANHRWVKCNYPFEFKHNFYYKIINN